jgi:hypothetical protein
MDGIAESQVVLEYRRRRIMPPDVRFIRELIAAHPDASRNRLSILLCEAWDWRQANGQLRDGVCRSLMLELHREGHIELPAVRFRPQNNAIARKRAEVADVDQTPIVGSLPDLGVLELRLVRRTEDEPVFDGLVQEHHYLGYARPVGEHLEYLVVAGGRPIACFAWASATRRLGLRDRFLGWSPEAREENLHLLASNSRFLMLPWVKVPHLASHLLGRMARRLSADWTAVYGHPVHFLESFVDTSRFRGTCYLAAHWIRLGTTTGRGTKAKSSRSTVPVKLALGYPLNRRFRELLGVVS